MQYDRRITISAAGSRKATTWPSQTLYWSEFVDRLKNPIRSTESLSEYLRLPKSQQDELKDVGGFVGGTLKDNRRKANNVINRDLLTLDLDNIPSGGTRDVLKRIEGLGCAYAVYSTRKHEEYKPRLRVVVPFDRSVSADEYEPLARKLASLIGMALADPTTFESSRLMYWPSCSKDSQYVFHFGDKPFANADGLLSMYQDWRDISEWPQVPGAPTHAKLAAKQGAPTEKSGIVGDFCRIYDVYSAIEAFLPGVYIAVDNSDDRYTYIGGSTVGGAVIYDNGAFLFSHHATDPCGGRLVNAFDLVRLHKFSDLDNDSKPDTPVNKLPSFIEMAKLAQDDPIIRKQRIEEDFSQKDRFKNVNTDWTHQLEEKPKGEGYKDTTENVKLILENDPDLAGKIVHNIFSYKEVLISSVPWRTIKKPWSINDRDISGLRTFLAKEYKITKRTAIEDALNVHLISNEFHPVRDYLNSLKWDGIPRVETLLIDYLGAEDNEINRILTRKTLLGAVARIFRPGCKFDYVLTLIGKQGVGKSSLIALLGGEWFSDSLNDVRGKDAYEQIQGNWIIEFAELAALRKSDMETVKKFTSAQVDKFRQAYARRSEEFPRQCIFIATTNDDEPLKDQTGARRFWPVAVGINPVDFSKRDNFPRDQIWAEAVEIFKTGEPLIIPRHIEKQLEELQKDYTEESPLAGKIREFLDKPWGIDFQSGVIKDRVCAMEIWCELLGFTEDKFTTAKAREINAILRNSPGWRVYPKNNGRLRHGRYGKQTVFERIQD